MPLPIIIGGISAAAVVTGVCSTLHGVKKLDEADSIKRRAQVKQKRAVNRFMKKNKWSIQLMDQLGKDELDILSTFDIFSNMFEKIQKRPEFLEYNKNGIELPKYEAEEIKKISTGAGLLLGGLGGAAVGTAGGFAAAGATTSAVMALGTASTGTAISSLSGVAATNATLAALGGGAIGSSAYAGGIALGQAVLGGATLGAGLLIGGIIFNVVGCKLADSSDEALKQAKRTQKEVNKICRYLDELISTAVPFRNMLKIVDNQYRKHLLILNKIINLSGKTNWDDFTTEEKKSTENLVLLVGLLYKMCQMNLVIKNANSNDVNIVNKSNANRILEEAKIVLNDIETIG